MIDRIEAIGIDPSGSLWVKPATRTFPYMWREGMEVHWDSGCQHLYSPPPREWSYLQWFCQITRAASEQGVELVVDSETDWNDLNQRLRDDIVRVMAVGGVEIKRIGVTAQIGVWLELGIGGTILILGLLIRLNVNWKIHPVSILESIGCLAAGIGLIRHGTDVLRGSPRA